MQNYRVTPVTLSFSQEVNQCTTFKASDWPACRSDLETALKGAIDSFLSYVAKGGPSFGP
jgi:hypothetical protein